MENQGRKSNRKLLIITLTFVVLMFGFGFAMVPLYNAFCKVLGINGKTNDNPITAYQGNVIDKTRSIRVEFLTVSNEKIPWAFKPQKTSIEMHPGENKTIYYFAKNNSDHDMTVQAIPSVAPGQAAKYIKKTECFCFERQTLAAGKEMAMPVVFHIDSHLPKDVHTISLSYTLFDIAKANTLKKVKGKIN